MYIPIPGLFMSCAAGRGEIIEHDIEYGGEPVASSVDCPADRTEIKATKEIPVCILTAAAARPKIE